MRMGDVANNNTQSIADYLAQLLKDKYLPTEEANDGKELGKEKNTGEESDEDEVMGGTDTLNEEEASRFAVLRNKVQYYNNLGWVPAASSDL